MSGAASAPPGFWTTVWLLLVAARRRAVGRQRRQRQLLRQRAGKPAMNWGAAGYLIVVLVMAGLNLLAALVVREAVVAGERLQAESHGLVVVDDRFFGQIRAAEQAAANDPSPRRRMDSDLWPHYRAEARRLVNRHGGNIDVTARKLRDAAWYHGAEGFVRESVISQGLKGLPRGGAWAGLFGSIGLFGWGIMLVFQGEGLELDIQRRRHPMWEWIFSHPVPPRAVFLAEMLSPIAANPIYCGAPLFVGTLFSLIYGRTPGLLAGILVGIPISVAAACLGKALEISVMLRLSPRSRGAMIGVMGWLGYASLMLFIFGLAFVQQAATALAVALAPLTNLPWPWLGIFLGQQADGGFSFLQGIIVDCTVAALAIAISVQFSIWGARRGLSGNFGGAAVSRPATAHGGANFGRGAMYRKELLWFARDRSALVQAVLIPVTMASLQLFNLRNLLAAAPAAWNYLCGAGILFGTYFLTVLGPRSLASEGNALWIALSWPQGLESLLKAKAWLWSLLASVLVGIVLCYAAIMFPQSAWKVALVGAGWFLFARSMAEKAVTLANVASSSGEPQKIPTGRRWATQLGTFTFAIGVLTLQWNVAVVGIVYSMMTAAAMWQNFRARLPYLYDPWSEQLPAAPTLMHAMVAISILVEGGAVVSAAAMPFFGRNEVAVAYAAIYGASAAIVSLGMLQFLSGRDVSLRQVWLWPRQRGVMMGWPVSLLCGVALGAVLGGVAFVYLAVVQMFPHAAEMMQRSHARIAATPHLHAALIVMSVLIAPVAEEFLFRGLLYRALDREWGGWRAVLGSAVFFAAYHPALSWLPVGLLGATNAVLFKRTGRLAPTVVLHMTYNAIVMALG